MAKEMKEQKIFQRFNESIEICGKCGGHGVVKVYPGADIFKVTEPRLETCPLCEGSGRLKKVVTVTTDLSPFKPE